MGMTVIVMDENKKEIDSFKPKNRDYFATIVNYLETDCVCTCGGSNCQCFDYANYKMPKGNYVDDDEFNEIRRGHEFVWISLSF